VIFKAVQDGRPYPDHGFSTRDWATVAPHSVRLDQLVTTKRELALDKLLDEDSTFYGDLFPHAVQWHGDIYLEDGLHRALRAALQQRTTMHVRVLDLDEFRPRATAAATTTGATGAAGSGPANGAPMTAVSNEPAVAPTDNAIAGRAGGSAE
jgi:Arc/MetJ family transcription regulator